MSLRCSWRISSAPFLSSTRAAVPVPAPVPTPAILHRLKHTSVRTPVRGDPYCELVWSGEANIPELSNDSSQGTNRGRRLRYSVHSDIGSRQISIAKEQDDHLMDRRTATAINERLKKWKSNSNIQVISFASTDKQKFWCEGIDLAEWTAAGSGGHDFLRECYDLATTIREYPKQTVLWLKGKSSFSALGLFPTKFVVGTATTEFRCSELSCGHLPHAGIARTMAAKCTPALASYLGLSGKSLCGEDLYAVGLATHIVDSDKGPSYFLECLGESLSDDPNLMDLDIDHLDLSIIPIHEDAVGATLDIMCLNAPEMQSIFRDDVWNRLAEPKDDLKVDIKAPIHDEAVEAQKIFSTESLETACERLNAVETQWARDALKNIQSLNPLIAKAWHHNTRAWHHNTRESRKEDVDEALTRDICANTRLMRGGLRPAVDNGPVDIQKILSALSSVDDSEVPKLFASI